MSRSSDSSHASAKFHRQYCGLAEAESVAVRASVERDPPPPTLTTIPGGFVVYEPQWDCCETGATNSWPNEQCPQQCAEQLGRFPVGSCAETFPLSALLRSKKRASDICSLATRNKDSGGVKACDTCPATLANIAQLPGLKILDMALPEFWWMYEEGMELADGGGHLGIEEDTES
ncbi:hypothetical protein TWF569_005239 [Orbilia oligospora]|nr:hypothetical protein TWF569_005239 [Orbilia oligospora]